MKIDKLNLDGKKASIEVLDKIFSAKINKRLVDNVLFKTNANYKGRHAKTKQQNEIAGFWDWMFNRDNWPCYDERYFTEGCYRDHEAGSRG